MSPIHPSILRALQVIEPNATFTAKSSSHIVSSSNNSYFVKVGTTTNDCDQFQGEAESLGAMHASAPGICPKVLHFDSEIGGETIMISEYKYLDELNSESARVLGTRLALELHDPERSRNAISSDGEEVKWGFGIPTYCGPTRIENGWYDSWDEAFGAMTEGLIAKLESKGGCSQLCELGKELREKVIPHLLSPSRLKDIKPVILHGDLWSGNVGTDQSGQPIIFDPASYYGHNESDLALSRMFGGFPRTFLQTYHTHRPKSIPESEYEQRQTLYEVFHYLNHVVIFGGGYVSQVTSRMKSLIAFCR